MVGTVKNDGAIAAAQMAGAGAESPTRRSDVGRSENYPGAKIRAVQTPAQALKTTTSAKDVRDILPSMNATIEVEMAAVRKVFANCAPDEGTVFPAGYTKTSLLHNLFGTVDDVLAIAKIYDRFGCLPSQIPRKCGHSFDP